MNYSNIKLRFIKERFLGFGFQDEYFVMRNVGQVTINYFIEELFLILFIPDPVHALVHDHLCAMLFLSDGEIEAVLFLLLPDWSQDGIF